MRRGLAILAFSFLAGCGASGEVAGGGGAFEGETVSLQGVVRRPDGNPLGRAKVWLHTPDWTQGSPQDTIVADDSGRFALRATATGVFRIEARKDTLWTHRQIETVGSGKTFDLPTAKPFPWHARIVPASFQPVRIAVYGCASSASVSNGSFVLERDSSQTAEWAKVDFADGRSLSLPLPILTDSVLDLSRAGGVLVDDFEGSGTRSVLGSQIGSGWWYALSDSASGGTSSVLPLGVVQDFSKAYSSSQAWSGKSLAVSFAMDTTRSMRYAEVGLEMANKGLWIDLSRTDSLSFMARGKGSFRFQVVTSTGMDPATGTGGDYAAPVTLDSAWTRIVLKPSDFVARSASQSTPASAAFARVRRILLISDVPVELGLDELRFHGPTLSDLVPRP